jgi:hypothetical protein
MELVDDADAQAAVKASDRCNCAFHREGDGQRLL